MSRRGALRGSICSPIWGLVLLMLVRVSLRSLLRIVALRCGLSVLRRPRLRRCQRHLTRVSCKLPLICLKALKRLQGCEE
jgi:hypothetical protein